MAPLFAHLSAEQARTYALVLASAGIDHTLDQHHGRWAITVPPDERRPALSAIAVYRRENPIPIDRIAPPPPPLRTFSAIYAALILMVTHAAVASDPSRPALVDAYGADARRIVGGQIYRCITALLLHADWGHLAANMGGTLLFGTYTAALYGWGVSWLLILFSGALGNLLTAFWHGADHHSIGASTAVFAAVGLCAAHGLWRRKTQPPGGWRAWAPLAGGLALVGWLGTAPQSDLLAHLLGFGCGLAVGSAYVRSLKSTYAWPVQSAALGVVALGIIGSWYWGMAYRG